MNLCIMSSWLYFSYETNCPVDVIEKRFGCMWEVSGYNDCECLVHSSIPPPPFCICNALGVTYKWYNKIVGGGEIKNVKQFINPFLKVSFAYLCAFSTITTSHCWNGRLKGTDWMISCLFSGKRRCPHSFTQGCGILESACSKTVISVSKFSRKSIN